MSQGSFFFFQQTKKKTEARKKLSELSRDQLQTPLQVLLPFHCPTSLHPDNIFASSVFRSNAKFFVFSSFRRARHGRRQGRTEENLHHQQLSDRGVLRA